MPQENQKTYPYLQVVVGPQEGLILPLKQGKNFIGRSKDRVALFLDDPSVSRLHAEIEVTEKEILLSDLASTYGTFVNETRLQKGAIKALAHLDKVGLGIYVLRLVEREMTPNDLAQIQKNESQEKPAETPLEKKDESHTYVVGEENGANKEESKQDSSEEPDSIEALEKGKDLLASEENSEKSEKKAGASNALVPFEEESIDREPWTKKLFIAFIILALIGATGAGVFIYIKYFHEQRVEEKHEEKKAEVKTSPADASNQPDSEKPEKPEEIKSTKQSEKKTPPVRVLEPLGPKDSKSTSSNLSAFLDISTKPLSAEIFLDEKRLGVSPLKTPVELTEGQTYTLYADFDLRDIHDKYRHKVVFTAEKAKDIYSFAIQPDIGTIKIVKLPRKVDFYLEGYYTYDKEKAHPVKLSDIVYGKPIYVPFGEYTLELREKTKISGSKTTVNEIRYHRDFTIGENMRTIEISVSDEDLAVFPVKIESTPSQADIILDGKKVGKTPYTGEWTLGDHKLVLSKEGYFDYETLLPIRTNIPFETSITLKTSKVGELLLKAQKNIADSNPKQAIELLIEALKLGGTENEKAHVHYLLGKSFLDQGELTQASLYFEQSKKNPDFTYPSLLGLAKIASQKGDKSLSLKFLVEVLLNSKPKTSLYEEAKALFKIVSPMQTVLYVASTPPGATVLFNNKEVAEKTPVIVIPDNAFGTFRIEVRKTGYRTEIIKKNINLIDFVPLFIELKPENL